MKLSDEQHRRLLQHLQTQWKAPVSCAICRSNDWDIPKEVYELREFHGGSMVVGGGTSIVPVIPVTCKVCGNTVVINPLIAGIDLKGIGSA